MKKLILLSFATIVCFNAFSQNTSTFLFSKKGSKSLKVIPEDTTLNSTDIQTLSFVLNCNFDALPKFDLIEVRAYRTGVEILKIAKEPAYFKLNSKANTRVKGNNLFEAKILDFITNTSGGEGSFYYETYRKFAGADFFSAHKATLYSTCPAQDEYELELAVWGYTLLKYEKAYNEATNEYTTYPVYNDPIKIVEPIKISIKTDESIKPLPKVAWLGDPEDLKANILGVDENTKSELGDKVCECLKKAKESNNEKDKKKCIKLHEKTFLDFDFHSDEKGPYMQRVKACEAELFPNTLNWFGN